MKICPQGENGDIVLMRIPVCTIDTVLTVNSVNSSTASPPWKGRTSPQVPAEAKGQAPRRSHMEFHPVKCFPPYSTLSEL